MKATLSARLRLRNWQSCRFPVTPPPLMKASASWTESAYYEKQNRLVTSRLGRTNPENIEDYIATGGYAGLEKALTMERQAVIDEMKKSGLRGRGGGGFRTGMKWQFVHDAVGDKKFIVCNADEGDPGAFMDRSVLEGDPHAVMEGMMIAAYAIGADEGVIYCRAEYPLAIRRLNLAIKVAEEMGIMGKNIMGSGFNFKMQYQGRRRRLRLRRRNRPDQLHRRAAGHAQGQTSFPGPQGSVA